MTEEAIAKEMGLEFRRVSPSTFLSMYVGETERKIKKVFKDAQAGRYVLFIDEAEGLFLDRQGAQRSWEKTQANELLQQVESFRGVLIIATNFADMMDPAFARRFLFHIKFVAPSVDVRKALWSNWRTQLQLKEDQVKNLAERFALSGGEIRNVAIRAKATSNVSLEGLTKLCEEVLKSRTGRETRKIGIAST
jgi:SpoVK/Ycf46/Vps4 family AAA+-type ATPase